MNYFFSWKIVLPVIVFFAVTVRAQYDPYERMIDPRAIARIDDLHPLEYKTGFGIPPERDADGHIPMVDHKGAGILTHIWTVSDVTNTSVWYLYIDDTLVRADSIHKFFLKPLGLMRPPLDTTYPGAYVCDVQMPFKRSFRLSCSEGVHPTRFYYAVAWRTLPDPDLVGESFRAFGSYYAPLQKRAEEVYRQSTPDWGNVPQVTKANLYTLRPGIETEITSIKGPGWIQRIACRNMSGDAAEYDSIRLRIYWDNSPVPSVDVPIADFYMQGGGPADIHSLYFNCSELTGLECRIPMPFQRSARITLTKAGDSQSRMLVFVVHNTEEVDRSKYGYFFSRFSLTPLTRYDVPHPVFSDRGAGRFIGMVLSIPTIEMSVAYEGDPMITIDSNPRYYIRYTGGEDYFNAGWHFVGTTFNSPFAGHQNRFKTAYKLHILDAIDFKRSIDFDFQHGVKNDVREQYRSVAYYYKRWVPYRVSRDTLYRGETVVVSGESYQPSEKITVSLDGVEISSVQAEANGTFSVSIPVPHSWIPGSKTLDVNSEVYPKPIIVLDKPIVYPVSDFKPVVVRYGDSLLVRGTGFVPEDSVQVFFDSILLQVRQPVRVDNQYRFEAIVQTPNIADRQYSLSVVTPSTGWVTAAEKVTISRNRAYEFEELVDSAEWTGDTLYREVLSRHWHGIWSRQQVATYKPFVVGDSVSFPFSIPAADTYKVQIRLTKGVGYGKYQLYLDDVAVYSFDGYRSSIVPGSDDSIGLYPTDTLLVGTLALGQGRHYWKFICVGKNDSANGYELGADAFFLIPTTVMPLAPGTITGSVSADHRPPPGLSIYPNPAGIGGINLVLETLPDDSGSKYFIDIVDPAGRVWHSEHSYIQSQKDLISIDTKDIPSGSYSVRLRILKGGYVNESTKQLIIQK